MATLQACLLSKPSLPFPSLRHPTFSLHHHSFNPLPPSYPHLTRLRSRIPSTSRCTFGPDSLTSPSEPEPQPTTPTPSEPDAVKAVDTKITNPTEELAVSDWNVPSSEHAEEEVVESDEGKSANLTKKKEEEEGFVVDSRLPLVVFFVALWARAREMVRRAFSEFLDWWPFWRQEKRLARLIAEADENPQDTGRQSALFVELNKHSPESVIKRFERRDCAVDSRGVAEYLRALVMTNAIAEYLPDEESGKPSSLPTLLQELKQRASGNLDETFLSPGISEKQPLHVMMVEPKASNKSRFAQELLSTILFTVAVGLVWY